MYDKELDESVERRKKKFEVLKSKPNQITAKEMLEKKLDNELEGIDERFEKLKALMQKAREEEEAENLF